MKNEGALRMRFSRQGGIYRSDVFSLLVNPVQMPPPVGRPRYRAIGRAGRSNTPCPSSAMSSALAIPQRVARQHCPSPLHQQCQIKSFARLAEMLYHRPVHSLLFVCLSPGDNPKAALERRPQKITPSEPFPQRRALVRICNPGRCLDAPFMVHVGQRVKERFRHAGKNDRRRKSLWSSSDHETGLRP